jgi:hypothetical protein
MGMPLARGGSELPQAGDRGARRSPMISPGVICALTWTTASWPQEPDAPAKAGSGAFQRRGRRVSGGADRNREALNWSRAGRVVLTIRATRPCDLRIVCPCPREGGCHSYSAIIPSVPEPRLTCRGPCGVLGATVAAAPPVSTSPVSSPVQAVLFSFLASHREVTQKGGKRPDVATLGALLSQVSNAQQW